jgi:hypothetical protein
MMLGIERPDPRPQRGVAFSGLVEIQTTLHKTVAADVPPTEQQRFKNPSLSSK